MGRHGRHYRFEAVLEAPLPLLVAAIVLVTVAVVVTGLAL